MRNFRNFADMLNNFPVNEAPVEVPYSNEMPDALAQAANEEAAAMEQAAAIAPKPVQQAAPVATQSVPGQLLDKIKAGKLPLAGGPSRAPAMDNSEASSPEAKKVTEIGRLEKLMQDMNAQRRAEMEDAASRQMKAQMLKGVTDNIGLLMAGSQAMNTKAGVSAPNVKSLDIGDQIAQVERRFKPEQEQLLSQYKELKDKNGELSEKDKAYLALGYEQLKLGTQRAGDANNRFYEGEGNRMYKFGVQQDQKDEYSDKQTEGLMGMDKTMTLLNDIEKQFDTGKYSKFLGPYASKYQNSKEYNPMSDGMDQDFAKFQSDVTDSLSQYIKSLSGLTVSDKERVALMTSMPKVGDKPQTFKAKLQATTARLNKMRQSETEALSKYQGKTGKVANRSSNSGTFEAPEQKPATVTDPSNDPRVENFMKKNNIKDKNEAITILKKAGKI